MLNNRYVAEYEDIKKTKGIYIALQTILKKLDKQLIKSTGKNADTDFIQRYIEFLKKRRKDLDLVKFVKRSKPTMFNDEELEEFFEHVSSGLDQLKLNLILERKNLSQNLLEKQQSISFSDDIKEHAKWLFQNIYSIPYPNHTQLNSNIARYHHGIQHVSRASLYVLPFANLYRKYGDKEALALTDEDIKLIQIAALFHDAAREDENEDKWDHESGIFLYFYLTKVLSINHEKAALLAEAVANKDQHKKGYFQIKLKNGKAIWKFKEKIPQKNIYQKIIHDVDSLDITRARPRHDAKYLDYFTHIAQHHHDKNALEEMAHLRMEAASLIEIGGDSYQRTKTSIKLKYENENGYENQLKDINPKLHPVMHTYGKLLLPLDKLKETMPIDITPYNSSEEMTDANMLAAIRSGKVFVRGIATPSAIHKKLLKSNEKETFAQREIRKSIREPGIPTMTFKSDNSAKDGNPARSVSMIGYGSNVFCNAGFMILDPDIDAIGKISAIDSDTGRGKKPHMRNIATNSREEKSKQLKELNQNLLMGGSSTNFGGNLEGYTSTHVEITYKIKKYDAIYFSNDPNLYNKDVYGSAEAAHPFSPLLQAVYLQKEYEKQYHHEYEKRRLYYEKKYGEKEALSEYEKRHGHKTLSIYEYSGIHNVMRRVPDEELTLDKLKYMWLTVCRDFLTQNIDSDKIDIYNMSPDVIKTLSIYKTKENRHGLENAPADSIFDNKTKEELDKAINKMRDNIIDTRHSEIITLIKNKECTIFDDKIFNHLLKSPSLRNQLHNEIIAQCNSEMNSGIEHEMDLINNQFNNNNFAQYILEDENYKRRLYEYKLFKIYTLANELNITNISKSIQDYVQEKLMSKINEFWDDLDQLDDIAGMNRLFKIFGFVKLFDLDKVESLKSKLNILVKGYFNHIVDKLGSDPTSSFNMTQLRRVISGFVKLNIQNDEMKKTASEVFDLFYKEVSERRKCDEEDLLNAIRIGLAAGTPANKLNNLFIQILTEPNNQIYLCKGNIAAFQEYKFLLEDTKIFNAMLKRLGLNKYPLITGNNSISFSDVLTHLELLKNIMPNKIFNQDQLSLIKQKLNDVGELLITQIELNPDDHIDQLSRIYDAIHDYLKSNSPVFPIPTSLVAAFNKYLQLEKDHNSSLFKKCIDLHDRLPLKEGRLNIISRTPKSSPEIKH